MTSAIKGAEIFDDVTVDLIDQLGSDHLIRQAARVSTVGELAREEEEGKEEDYDKKLAGLIRYLIANRHGTPFEHNALIFYVRAPIMVFREFHRHRIGFSYNEMSGRYTELPNEFYIPSVDRPGLMQKEGGKPGQYEYVNATIPEWQKLSDKLMHSYDVAWETYKELLADGYAKEIARSCLPVGIYSQMYVTCNLRSLMSFLGLRTKRPSFDDGKTTTAEPTGDPNNTLEWRVHDPKPGEWAMFPSKPQVEIEMVANLMETAFSQHFPVTYRAWEIAGRVAP